MCGYVLTEIFCKLHINGPHKRRRRRRPSGKIDIDLCWLMDDYLQYLCDDYQSDLAPDIFYRIWLKKENEKGEKKSYRR